MTDPISSSAATTAVAGLTLLSLIPGLDPAAVLGAFAGALVFIITADELSNWRKGGLFLAAFLIGMLAAEQTARVVNAVLPATLAISGELGALLASALCVHLLQWLLRKDPDELLPRLRKRGNP